ncbi:MAG TPA: nodulation protein NfeD [Myxococcota bacterium]|nr:nodulation protein NfeD [Myxococcota bacterium]
MRRGRFRALVLAAFALLAALAAQRAHAQSVSAIRIDGAINPAIADYVVKSIAAAHASGASALVIELDTPGGLVSSTKDIVTAILNAELPVIVFVSPRGAWAASAGTFITLSGHVAAMAPGTTIGAAHPVTIGGDNPKPPEPESPADGKKAPRHSDFMAEKLENFTAAFIESIAAERKRNVEWAASAVRNSVAIGAPEALRRNVIDLLADDLDDLLVKVDGRSVHLGKHAVTLHTRGVSVVRLPMDLVTRVFAVIADPQIVGLLFLIGLAGIYVEFQNPGLVAPGVIGAVALLLAATALQIIPFNWVGLLLVAGGVALIVAEVHVSSYGALFGLGLGALCWGAWLTFHVPELSDLSLPFWRAILPTALTLALVMLGLAWTVSRAQARPQYAGAEGLLAEIGTADSDLSPQGRVRVRGELWNAVADAPVRRGDKVEILAVENLVLRVRPRAGGREGGGE